MKALLLVVALVAVVVATGGAIAYAWHTGCVGKNEPSTCHPKLVWENPSGATPSAGGVTCSVSLTPSTLTETVGNLAPGQYCNVHAMLVNTGTVAETINQTVTIIQPAGCHYFGYSDDIPHSPPHKLAPSGGHFEYTAKLSLLTTAGNGCQGKGMTVTVTITGTQTNPGFAHASWIAPLARPASVIPL
jgi:hypothetical protein